METPAFVRDCFKKTYSLGGVFNGADLAKERVHVLGSLFRVRVHRRHNCIGQPLIDRRAQFRNLFGGGSIMMQSGSSGGIGHLPRKLERDQMVTGQRERKDVDPMVCGTSADNFRGHVQWSPCAIPRRHESFRRR